MSIKDFAEAGTAYIKSPLGLIGFFVVLIYGLASLTLLKGESLTPGQMNWLVGLIVLFPLVVLGVFSWLVTRHHQKLYAPADWRNEDNFFRRQSPAERAANLAVEEREAEMVVGDHGQVLPEGSTDADQPTPIISYRSTGELLRAAEIAALAWAQDLLGRPEFLRGAVLEGTNAQLFQVDGLAVDRINKRATVIEVKLGLSGEAARRFGKMAFDVFREIRDATTQRSFAVDYLLVVVVLGMDAGHQRELEAVLTHEAKRELLGEEIQVVVLDLDELDP